MEEMGLLVRDWEPLKPWKREIKRRGPLAPETCRKISAAHRGKVHSAKTRAKISAGVRRAHAERMKREGA